MSALPSFVELMSSLGLEQRSPQTGGDDQSSSSPPSSPRSIGSSAPSGPSRSSSNSSLREAASVRHRLPRFSPYQATMSFTRRRSTDSSISSLSDLETSPLSATFAISPRSPVTFRMRRPRNKLTVNTYGSMSDLTADTPISTYVRRKTPGTSPTSPTFNQDSGYESSDPPALVPFTIPSLPVLLPNSASSESFPTTPTSDAELPSSLPTRALKPLSDSLDNSHYYRFIRRRTGVRLSAPSLSERKHHHHQALSSSRRRQLADTA